MGVYARGGLVFVVARVRGCLRGGGARRRGFARDVVVGVGGGLAGGGGGAGYHCAGGC